MRFSDHPSYRLLLNLIARLLGQGRIEKPLGTFFFRSFSILFLGSNGSGSGRPLLFLPQYLVL